MIEQIIFTDSDKIIRQIMGKFLETCGYKFIATENCEEAYVLYQQLDEQRRLGKKYLLITELHMPKGKGMDGLEFARKIRNEHQDLQIPILALTNYGGNLAPQSIEYFDEIFFKPPKFKDLERTLTEYANEVVV